MSDPMAKVPINDPKHWRQRAQEARAVAQGIADEHSRKKLLRTAADYEELARRAEKRMKTGPENSH
jgi:molecular chaperone GrpE (heat shock protein)